MTFTANPFDMTGTVDTTGLGLASGAAVLPSLGAITGATVASGIVTFTTADTTYIYEGQAVTVAGVTGFTTNNPNNTYIVKSVPSSTTFTVAPLSAPTGSYSSGGTIRYGADPGNTSAASVSACFTDATLLADAANRVLTAQPLSPYLP